MFFQPRLERISTKIETRTKELVFRRRSPWELAELIAQGFKGRGERDMVVHTDPGMWVTDPETGVSIAEEVNDRLADLGSEIILVKANGDRVNGWARVHQYLHPDHPTPDGDAGPLLRVLAHAAKRGLGCPYLIETLPAQVHDPNRPGDLAKTERGAAVDALRYLLAGRPPIATLPPFAADAEPHHMRVHSRTQRLLAGVRAKKRRTREIRGLGDLFS